MYYNFWKSRCLWEYLTKLRVCRSGENGAENNKAASRSKRSNSLRSHTQAKGT